MESGTWNGFCVADGVLSGESGKLAAFFCPRSYVIEFMTILILVKIGLCGFTFAYYLRSHYQDTGYKVVLFSTFYAMSGFICAYNWNIMWLDTVLLTPLIILGVGTTCKREEVYPLCSDACNIRSVKLLYLNYALLLSCSVFCDSYAGGEGRETACDCTLWCAFPAGGRLWSSSDTAGDSNAGEQRFCWRWISGENRVVF